MLFRHLALVAVATSCIGDKKSSNLPEDFDQAEFEDQISELGDAYSEGDDGALYLVNSIDYITHALSEEDRLALEDFDWERPENEIVDDPVFQQLVLLSYQVLVNAGIVEETFPVAEGEAQGKLAKGFLDALPEPIAEILPKVAAVGALVIGGLYLVEAGIVSTTVAAISVVIGGVAVAKAEEPTDLLGLDMSTCGFIDLQSNDAEPDYLAFFWPVSVDHQTGKVFNMTTVAKESDTTYFSYSIAPTYRRDGMTNDHPTESVFYVFQEWSCVDNEDWEKCEDSPPSGWRQCDDESMSAWCPTGGTPSWIPFSLTVYNNCGESLTFVDEDLDGCDFHDPPCIERQAYTGAPWQ